MDYQFRNALMGGFNRQDVMEYLEKISREHGAALQALQAQVGAMEEEKKELLGRLEQSETGAQALAQSLQKEHALRTASQAQEQEQSQAMAQRTALLEEERDRLRAQIAQLTGEREQLQAQVARLEPDALAYAAVKERSAGMELEAHRRAQGILDEAEHQSRQLRQQTDQWLVHVEREYQGLRGQVDAAVAAAAGQLDQIRQLLDGIPQKLAAQDGALEGLAQAYAETDHARVPAPMPLEETP